VASREFGGDSKNMDCAEAQKNLYVLAPPCSHNNPRAIYSLFVKLLFERLHTRDFFGSVEIGKKSNAENDEKHTNKHHCCHASGSVNAAITNSFLKFKKEYGNNTN